MGLSVEEGERIAEILPRLTLYLQPARDRLRDQLWLRTVLVEQRRRLPMAERAAFDRRADRLLEALDPQEPA